MATHRSVHEPLLSAPESFLRHSEALRSLARALLRDPAQADDAVQDTWLAWLESPPRDAAHPATWLKRVLRNRVINLRRARARRESHERAAARPEQVDEKLSRERDDALRAVVSAVLALDEPAKEVVWQRYFEDRSVEEIAARLRLSVRAVYERLSQAHACLRRRLEADSGDERRSTRALLILAGRGGDELALRLGAATSLGAWLSGPAVLLAAAVVVVALVAWLAWRPTAEEVARAQARDAAPAVGAQQLEPVRELELGAGDAQLRRSAVESPLVSEPAPARWNAPGYEYEVELVVVDESDLPVSAAALYAAPAGHTLNRIGECDDSGVFVARFRAFTATVELDLASEPHGPRRRIALASGRSAVGLRGAQLGAHFVMRGAGLVRGRVIAQVTASGSALGELRVAMRSAGEVSALVDDDGWITFVEPRLTTNAEFDAAVEARYVPELFHAAALTRSMDSELGGSSSAADGASCELTGRILDEHGEPVPSAVVYLRRNSAGTRLGFETNAAGEFTASGLMPGDWELRAGGGDCGRAAAQVTLVAGERRVWSPRLDPGRVLRGRLLDRDGAPLGDWIVEIDAGGPQAHVDSASTDAEGRFELANAPAGFVRVLARPAWASGMPAVLVHERASVVSSELELRAPLSATDSGAQLRFTANLGEPGGVRDCELRVVRADSGQIALAPLTGMEFDEHGASGGGMSWFFAADKLLPGEYELELHLPARLPFRVGALHAGSGGSYELRESIREPGARLAVDPRPSESGAANHVRLVLRGAHFELVSEAFDAALGAQLEIAPGEYELVSDQALRRLASFELAGGATLRIAADNSLEPAQPQR